MRFTADPGVPGGAACKAGALKSTGEEVRACADGMMRVYSRGVELACAPWYVAGVPGEVYMSDDRIREGLRSDLNTRERRDANTVLRLRYADDLNRQFPKALLVIVHRLGFRLVFMRLFPAMSSLQFIGALGSNECVVESPDPEEGPNG